jgi:hypothetical protein
VNEKTALAAFVEGRISFSALRNALAESTAFAFLPDGTIHIQSLRQVPTTGIRPRDVQREIERYQLGELTREEVSVWGVVLRSLDSFELEGVDESRKEELWDVIAHLSLASVNPAFTDERVSDLLDRVLFIVRESAE